MLYIIILLVTIIQLGDNNMEDINPKEVCDILNEIMEYELAGVVRYTHSSLMITICGST